jgi:hypothetical protein
MVHRFLASFAKGTPEGEMLVAPTSVLDHWCVCAMIGLGVQQ